MVADPVVAGVLFASLEGPLVSEPSITASAIGHWMLVVERKRVAMGRSTWGFTCMTRHGLSIACQQNFFHGRLSVVSKVLICKLVPGAPRKLLRLLVPARQRNLPMPSSYVSRRSVAK